MEEEIEKLLADYRLRGEAALVKEEKDYPSFKDLEKDYCALINEGNSIRVKILQNPDCCDKSTYMVLTNEVKGFVQGLRGKFKPLALVFLLTQRLYQFYKQKLEEAVNAGCDEEVINFNEQLYNLSKKYIYRKNIADLLYQKYKNFKQAIEIYKEIESSVDDKDYEYWKNYAELNAEYENFEKRDFCMTKYKIAKLKSDVKKVLDDKDYEKAINLYEELFSNTGDYSYKKEIANIYAVCYMDIKKAIKIYHSLEEQFGSDSMYWFQLSSLYEYNKNYYKEVLCIKKAIDIELSKPEVNE